MALHRKQAYASVAMKVFLTLMLALATMPASAQSTTAKTLSDTCQRVLNAIGSKGTSKGKWDLKRPEDIYASGQCEGFIEGWMDGIDGAILTNDKGPVLLQIKRSQITDSWTIAGALIKHLNDVPLDDGKPADTVLRQILVQNELITLTPYYRPSQSGQSGAVDELQNTSSPQ